VGSCTAATGASRREPARKDAARGRDPPGRVKPGKSLCLLHRLASAHGAEGLSLKPMLYSSQTPKEWLGNSAGRASLGMPKKHIKEKNNTITFMFWFLSQMLP